MFIDDYQRQIKQDENKGNGNNIMLLGQQLRDFGQQYLNHLEQQTDNVNEYKRIDEEKSIISLLQNSHVVEDFLNEINESQKIDY